MSGASLTKQPALIQSDESEDQRRSLDTGYRVEPSRSLNEMKTFSEKKTVNRQLFLNFLKQELIQN
jgi:hypothetical protein